MIDFVEISLGAGTVCACRQCGRTGPDEYRSTEDVLADVSRAVAGWPPDGGPGPNVVLTGPEPYRHPHVSTLVQRAIAAGVERLSLLTDAAALRAPGTAESSVDAGVRHIEVPLLGGCPEVHDALCGRRGSFESAVAGMQAMKAAGSSRSVRVLVCGRVHVCSHNVREVPAIVVAFAQAGASSVTLELDGSVPRTVARPWVGAAIDTGIVSNVWVALEGAAAADYNVPGLHDYNAAYVVASVEEVSR